MHHLLHDNATSNAPPILQTLGGAALFAGDDPDRTRPLLELGKPLALVLYVACAPRQEVPREHLHDLLWADLEPDAARHALRQTLWYLRRRLPFPVLAASKDVVSVAASLYIDRDDVLDAVGRGDAERVVALYRGDFVPSYAAPGGARFEQWAEVERATLRAHFVRSTEALIRQRLSSGRFRDAQDLARRLRDGDPLRESSWRLLLESLLAGSETVAALIEAENLERLLEREELEPEPATRALLRMARNPVAAAPSPSEASVGLSATLVGREREFAAILDAWTASQQGKPAHLHITAPAGLGKSRLLSDVRARLRAARGRVVVVRAKIGQRDVPFALASELAAAVATLPGARGVSPSSASALVAMNPTLSSQFDVPADHAYGTEALRRRILAMCELLDAISHEHPVAVLVDDVHWTDDASRAVLRGLVECQEHTRTLLLTSARPVSEGDVRGRRTQILELAPLSVSDVSALVESIAALPDAPWAEGFPAHLTNTSRGSPLLVLETLQLLIEQGFLDINDAQWNSRDPAALEATIASGSALARRVTGLAAPEHEVLLVLATAGTPIRIATLASALEHGGGTVDATLLELERRGFAARAGDAWTVAHDEIASSAVALASIDQQRAVSGALGRVLWREAGDDALALRQAARHLRDAGDADELRQLYFHYVRQRRSGGDRRRSTDLASDLVGAGTGRFTPRRLQRTLPWRWRVGLYSRARVATASGAAVLVAGTAVLAVLAARSRPAPDAEFVVLVRASDSTAVLHRSPIFARSWTPGRPIRLTDPERVWLPWPQGGLAPRPVTNTWFYTATLPDSGGLDLVEWSPSRQAVRRTFRIGDDYHPSLSPDGRHVVFVTGRFNRWSRYDLAIADLATGDVRQLTSGDDTDVTPAWSPDGMRIAFVRKHWTQGVSVLCVIAVDGGDLTCLPPFPDGDAASVLGWVDEERMLTMVQAGDVPALEIVDWPSGRRLAAGQFGRGALALSPDARWLACACSHAGYSEGTLLVMPLGRPYDARPLDMRGSGGGNIAFGWRMLASPRYLDSFEIDTGLRSIFAGVPHRLRAVGRGADGQPVEARHLRWRLLSTTEANLDSLDGVLVSHDTGHIRVEVSAAGWRKATAVVAVRPAYDEEVARLAWSRALAAIWHVIGTPQPFVTADPRHGMGLVPNGDSSFYSGVLSRAAFDSRDGLSLEVELSTPRTLPQWQTLHVGFRSALGSSELTPQRLLVGEVPAPEHRVSCEWTFPIGERMQLRDSAQLASAREIATFPVPGSLASGAWYRVRVQVLPDGRCGAALNGEPVALSRGVSPHGPMQISIGGYSFQTEMRVGPVTIRRGVPVDIDWAAFERARHAPGRSAHPRLAPSRAPARRDTAAVTPGR